MNPCPRFLAPLIALVCGLAGATFAQQSPSYPIYQVQAPAAAPAPAPAANPAPPPSAPAQRSAADLEKLVAPIALYPDPLIATILPASVYPLEIVQAARFVADTNNLAKLDAQPWDDNVKAVARVPEVIKKLNEDIAWTSELGEAFLASDKAVMDAIQAMRAKAQKAGTLQTSQQQIVVVTNLVVETTVQQQIVYVTNTVVQIQPANPQVVYVPTYNPYTVYYPPPGYVYNPVAPLVTFGVGMAVGAIIANNCDWYHGGCYHGYHGGSININGDVNINRGNINTGNINSGNRVSANNTAQKWQPDQSRLSKSGSTTASTAARTAEARGWSGGTGASGINAGARPTTGAATARPSTGAVSSRPTATPSAANRPAAAPSVSRPSASPSTMQARPSAAPNRTAPSSSAFSGASSGAGTRDFSNRGSASRSFSGGGGARSAGGGARGGGRR